MSDEQSIRDAPSINEIRADFIALHTRNFDAYMAGRSLTSEQEFYGAQFDSVIRRIQAEALRKFRADLIGSQFARYGIVLPDINEIVDDLDERADAIERGGTA